MDRSVKSGYGFHLDHDAAVVRLGKCQVLFNGKNPLANRQVIAAFGGEVARVTLGFTPLDTAGFACRKLHEEDCTFFIRGQGFHDFSAKALRIPSLSHA